MNQDIDILYQNALSISFYWKCCPVEYHKKVQLIFHDTGLLLTTEELVSFSQKIDKALGNSQALCSDCENNAACRPFLLATPAPQISFAVNRKELHAVRDLVDGTLFQIDLNNLLSGLG